MSLKDRIALESKKMNPTDFLMKNCFQCKYWGHFVKKDYSYCHRCVNNLRISLKQGKGLSIEGLYDYYLPCETLKQVQNLPEAGKTCQN